MKIALKDYGTILTSRPAGKEAALVMKAYAKPNRAEKVELDFDGVLSVSPAWLDEVLTTLRRAYGKNRVVCLPTTNPSVAASLKVIDGR